MGKQKGSPKDYKFGGKQKHGNSRAAYFAQAKFRIARNKARRAAKEARRVAKVKREQQQ